MKFSNENIVHSNLIHKRNDINFKCEQLNKISYYINVLNIKVNNESVSSIASANFLGIQIDQHLNWISFIQG